MLGEPRLGSVKLVSQNATFHSLENLNLEKVQLPAMASGWAKFYCIQKGGKQGRVGMLTFSCLLLTGCEVRFLLRGVDYCCGFLIRAPMFPDGVSKEVSFEYSQ